MELTSLEKNCCHKLEGFAEEWIETNWNDRNGTYTNLDAGTYIFKVKASNYHGIWSDNMADENFSIEELSIQACYRTMHLYRKIKSPTGQTPQSICKNHAIEKDGGAAFQKK